jgi:hypothetical protein
MSRVPCCAEPHHLLVERAVGNRHAICRFFAQRIARETLSGGPVARPSLYSRTLPPQFDKSSKKFCLFRALNYALRLAIVISGRGSVSDCAIYQASARGFGSFELMEGIQFNKMKSLP